MTAQMPCQRSLIGVRDHIDPGRAQLSPDRPARLPAAVRQTGEPDGTTVSVRRPQQGVQ
jgi:hypothetical protein